MANYQQRTVDWCIQRAFWHAFRKAAPAQTSPKYSAALAIADSAQKMWADEAETGWDSMYQLVQLAATVPAATDPAPIPAVLPSVALDPSIDYVSQRDGNPVLITSTSGGDPKRFEVIKPNQLYEWRYKDAVAQEGRNLIFSHAFAANDALVGGSIQIPAYVFPPDIAASTDNVIVDNPMWLVYMIAAELVRNDVVKRPEYNNILAMADAVMEKMLDANGGQRTEAVTPWRPAGESWI